MTLRFGTDGVRGLANVELTPEFVLALGRAAARTLCSPDDARVVIGRDTRRSGPLLEAALAAGFAAEGVDVELVGVLPTPGVAGLCATEAVVGAVVSASHNGYADNGVKLFAAGGRKLGAVEEAELEAVLAQLTAGSASVPPRGGAVGSIANRGDGVASHVERIVGSLQGRGLDGFHVVVDCANGAASVVGPEALRRLGATVTVLNDQPDGTNINDGCGSTDPSGLQRVVVQLGADAGLAFDGDADRVVAVDDQGVVVDGDRLLALCAIDRSARDQLVGQGVVVTVMTNLGFGRAMAAHGIKVVVTDVGDRNVLAAMASTGIGLGGEQSGHVVFAELATTGDGVLTGVQALDVVVRAGRSFATVAAEAMVRLPQVLRSVAVTDADVAAASVASLVAQIEADLGGEGRILVRPSGTEPVVRVMVEAPTEARAQDICNRVCMEVRAAAHGPRPRSAP